VAGADVNAVGLKICGVRRLTDYAACGALGVTSIGLNFWSGSRRCITADEARALFASGPRRCELVGVFVDRSPAEVAAIARALRLDMIQPHGDGPIAGYAALGIPYVWVIRGTPACDALVRAIPKPAPARILLDAAVPGFGGAGVQTDWTWARQAIERLSTIAPVWLAGGIRVENARQALVETRPAGLDVASGVESRREDAEPGEKDPALIARLLEITRALASTSRRQVQRAR
jgi:phosphoribosylanthranilate isomerase